MTEKYRKICFSLGLYSCGKSITLPKNFSFEVSTFTGQSSPTESKLEPTPNNLSPNLINDIRESRVYVSYNIVPNKESESDKDLIDKSSTSTSQSPDSLPKKKNAFVLMMGQCNSFPMLKTNSSHKDVLQYNKIIEYLKSGKYGVPSGSITDYCDLIDAFSSMIWDLDCHYSVIQNRGCHIAKEFESFLGFNDPKAHKHRVPYFEPLKFSSHVVKIYKLIDKNYMEKII